ncbi:MAG TPA: hypothetical protein PK836_09020 [Syntrophales bacterium]|nr:hypothetical protein [Syntrophales bacterium]HOM07795.1 hypothetical protein [Syntrophales bacterium]HOO00483.1 hypothetical protein [Syntrophales bacterium]HPC01806.1 hypothetical protein [Syntrophales bacterium]HPQ07287.1 hypothetical protein [Syntrophales bacterium]
MALLICPECAYTTDDPRRRICERCKSDLVRECPYCRAPITAEPAIYCDQCGEKLRVSHVPLQ